MQNAFTPKSEPEPEQAFRLSGWSLAQNNDGDLIFMYTEGYTLPYLWENSAPGGAYFTDFGLSVKSRDSNAHFMVLRTEHHCSRDQMVEYARRWGGYEVTGSEKAYYVELIEEADRAKD